MRWNPFHICFGSHRLELRAPARAQAAILTLTPPSAAPILQAKPISEQAGDAVRAAGEKLVEAGEKVKETLVAAKDTVVGLPTQMAHHMGKRPWLTAGCSVLVCVMGGHVPPPAMCTSALGAAHSTCRCQWRYVPRLADEAAQKTAHRADEAALEAQHRAEESK